VSVAAPSRRADDLAAALNPASIAIIGASDNPHKVGGRPLMYLSRFGYRGRVYPVNPSRDVVQGLKAYPDLASLPEVPDLAVVAVPAAQAPGTVRACAACGVKVAIVMASGFGETMKPAGRAIEAEMVADARAAGMRVVGPNSQGLANFGTGAVASFSTMFVEVEPADGPVAIVSQSGVMSVLPYGLLRARGVGVRHAHATGNDADITLPELTLAVVRDPDVRLVLLYIESIRDPEVLAQAAAIARDRDLPIVAVKSGRTARGAQAARSHTGALASDDKVVDAFLRRHGIWRANDMHELVRTSELYLKGWRPRGREIVIVSNSGASGVMAADTAAEYGLSLATFSETTRQSLAAELPDFASVANPIDITAALLTESRLFGNLLPLLARERTADLFLIAIPVAGEGYDVPAFARDAAAFAATTGQPVVVAAPQDSVAARFRAAGLPTFTNQTDAIAALSQIVSHAALMAARPQAAAAHLTVHVPTGTASLLNEADSLAFLGAHGLPIVTHVLCHSEDDARRAFARFGGPVVVKACSGDAPHKSDVGLVLLNVRSADAVAAAFRTLSTRLAELNLRHEGVLVAEMVAGRREVALGARIDPTFGPVVMVSDGGRYVEALPDLALLLPPFADAEARAAWRSLRMAPLFDGVRGDAALDLDALCDITMRLGHIVHGGAEQLTSIDLNPVMVGAVGEGVVVADALIERAGPR
jgi:acyl-CoA synthetase (NDP forming)